MIVVNLNEGPKAQYSLHGTTLKVHGVSIDLAARQRDVQTVVDISLSADLKTAADGVGAWYVATVVIPPREYEAVETGDTDETGRPILAIRSLPLDTSKVELRLWALPRTVEGGE